MELFVPLRSFFGSLCEGVSFLRIKRAPLLWIHIIYIDGYKKVY